MSLLLLLNPHQHWARAGDRPHGFAVSYGVEEERQQSKKRKRKEIEQKIQDQWNDEEILTLWWMYDG